MMRHLASSPNAEIRDANSGIPPTADGVVAAIAGASVCQGWDIVCSYHLDELNRMLSAHLTSSGKGSVAVPFSEPGIDITGKRFTVTGQIVLDTPGLSFSVPGLNGICQVTMPIASGVYTITPDGGSPGEPQSISQGYSVVALVYLVSVWGDGTPAAAGNGVVEFGTKSAAANVTLHFNTSNPSEITWSFAPTPTGEETILTEYVLPAVVAYFRDNVKEVDYTLTSISNAAPATPQGVSIVPHRFTFATWSSGDDHVLSIFVQTAAGTSSNPTTTPIVQHPLVSRDHLVSMVLSPEFMGGAYIQPQLNAPGTSTPPTTGEPTYSVCLTSNSPTIQPQEVDIKWTIGDDENVTFDATTIPLGGHVFTLGFSSSELTITTTLSVQRTWQHWYLTRWGADPDYDGTATISLSLNKQQALSEAATVGDGALSVTTAVRGSDFVITTDPGHGADCFNSDAANSIANAAQSAVAGALPETTSIACGSLDYLRITNLLFPGQNVIHLDPGIGLKVPFDFAVLGNFGANTDS